MKNLKIVFLGTLLGFALNAASAMADGSALECKLSATINSDLNHPLTQSFVYPIKVIGGGQEILPNRQTLTRGREQILSWDVGMFPKDSGHPAGRIIFDVVNLSDLDQQETSHMEIGLDRIASGQSFLFQGLSWRGKSGTNDSIDAELNCIAR